MLRSLLALLLVLGGAAQAACGPDPAPAQAAAVGFTCETFWDGPFTLSTIDVNNTGGAPWSATNPSGFKWYPDFRWIRSINSAGWAVMGVTPAGDLSITGGNKLLIAPTGPTITTAHPGMIISCAPTATAPYYQGTAFAGGYYFEGLATWPNGNSNPGAEGSWPNGWTWSTTFLTATQAAAVKTSEVDNWESCCTRNINTWTHAAGDPAAGANAHNGCSTCGNPAASGVKYGALLVPGYLNSGVAKLDWYNNDVFKETQSTTGGTLVGQTSAMFDEFANDASCIILGAGQNNPMTVTSIKVWQLPRPTGSGNGGP